MSSTGAHEMKVQTFEELWHSAPISRIDSEASRAMRATASYWFMIGMENAARICEERAELYRSGFHYSREAMVSTAETCATRIRESAK